MIVASLIIGPKINPIGDGDIIPAPTDTVLPDHGTEKITFCHCSELLFTG